MHINISQFFNEKAGLLLLAFFVTISPLLVIDLMPSVLSPTISLLIFKFYNEKTALRSLAFLVAVNAIWVTDWMPVMLPFLAVLVILTNGGFKTLRLSLSPPFVFMILLLIWGGVSLLWGTHPAVALKAIGNLSFVLLSAVVLVSAVQDASLRVVEKTPIFLQVAYLFLLCLIVLHAFGIVQCTESVLKFKFSGSMIGLMTFVTCSFLWVNHKKTLASLLFFGGMGGILLTHCQSAAYGLILGSGVFLVSYGMPFWTTRILLVSSYTLMILTPFIYGFLAPLALTVQAHWATTLGKSFVHRVLIWDFMAMKFQEHPFLGWGMGASPFLATQDLAPGFKGDYKPHNCSLQAYLELGLLGGIVYALLFASFFWLVEKKVKDRLSVAVCNATLFYVFVQRTVDNELWDHKRCAWFALIGATVLVFIQARAGQQRALSGR